MKYDKYGDIAGLSRPPSSRPRMTMSERAAQFSAFAALTGYDELVREQERRTSPKRALSEEENELLNERFALLQQTVSARPRVKFVYFAADEKKEGGAYRTVEGNVKKIESFPAVVTLTDGTKIPVSDICSIEWEEEG